MPPNINNLKAMLASGEIDKTRWRLLFSTLPESTMPTCLDCVNRKNGTCRDETTPIECFLYGNQSRADDALLKKENIRKFD